ncbi:hypothetical protein AXF42_Ash013274 [Apostasia shenzhenica]|uniref:Uncharacterized protein n=1 Tax=Apostasia shenzhenica TaxID=1088818 RepID=A0A2I0BBI0_9ASPA|nr:hypothetical protein AXF42_Ash013274 [Apostasia shenzhenica]
MLSSRTSYFACKITQLERHCIEGDSLKAIKMLQDQDEVLSIIGHKIKKIRKQMENFDNYVFYHVEGNRVADNIDYYALFLDNKEI